MKTFGTRQERPRKIIKSVPCAPAKAPAKTSHSPWLGRPVMLACTAMVAAGTLAGAFTTAVSQEPPR